MLDVICREIKNYFTSEEDRKVGNFSIVDGKLMPPISIPEGQYYRIVGSIKNDDVYISGQEELTDENVFHGAIWLMRPPKAFLALVNDIEAWQEKYGGNDSIAMSPFSSESFGGYSYSKSGGSNSNTGQDGITWQSAFANRLVSFRRARTL